VFKRPSGPQQSHTFIQFGQKNGLKIKKMINGLEIFPFIDFENTLYFLLKSIALGGALPIIPQR
jgi:hypothetical protein